MLHLLESNQFINLFTIDDEKGQIQLLQSLSTLNTAGATLVVRANDPQNPELSVMAEVHIEVSLNSHAVFMAFVSKDGCSFVK